MSLNANAMHNFRMTLQWRFHILSTNYVWLTELNADDVMKGTTSSIQVNKCLLDMNWNC